MDTYEIARLYELAHQALRDYYDERCDADIRDVARGICIAHLENPDEIVCSTPLQVYDVNGRNISPKWNELVPRWVLRREDAQTAINVVRNGGPK